jgi:ABC-type nickel/cobalt efflux system permease component RcnA
MTGAANIERLAVAALLVLLAPLGAQISALALSATVAALLGALALWELRTLAHDARATDLARRWLRRARSCATFDTSSNNRRDHHENRGHRWQGTHRRQRRPSAGRARA